MDVNVPGRVGFEADKPDPGSCRGITGDQVGGRATVAGAVAEHHVDLFGFVKAAPLCGAGSGAPRAGLCVGTPARRALT